MTLEEQKAKAEAVKAAMRRLFSTADGKLVLESLGDQVDRGIRGLIPQDGAPLDPGAALFNEGARMVVRRIRDILKEKPNE